MRHRVLHCSRSVERLEKNRKHQRGQDKKIVGKNKEPKTHLPRHTLHAPPHIEPRRNRY